MLPIWLHKHNTQEVVVVIFVRIPIQLYSKKQIEKSDKEREKNPRAAAPAGVSRHRQYCTLYLLKLSDLPLPTSTVAKMLLSCQKVLSVLL